jgi:hypothetical protein
MTAKKGYNGYQLTEQSRDNLLRHIPPIYPDVIAHHITHEFNIVEQLPPDAITARVTYMMHGNGVQAAIVKVNGTTTRTYEDSFYHVTISVDRAAGAKPQDSNALIKDSKNWTVVSPFDLDVVPRFFPFGG